MNVYCCSRISGIKVQASASGCLGPTSLSLSGTATSDIGVQAWASGRYALTTLNLCDCAKITVEGCHSFLVALSRGTQLVATEVPKRKVRQNGKRMLKLRLGNSQQHA